MSFHKLDKARDKNFWSVRVSSDIRLIVHKTPRAACCCATSITTTTPIDWAERRKLETHPKTGAAQLVEIRETGRGDRRSRRTSRCSQPAPPKPPLFAAVSDDELLSYGVPAEWLDEVRRATEDTLLRAGRPPARRGRRGAAGAGDRRASRAGRAGLRAASRCQIPFDHPDAQRRFRVVTNVEELERALEYPWEKWTVFLHPAQRAVGGAGLRRPGAGVRFGGHREDHRRAAPGRLPGAGQSRCPRAAHDLLRDAGQRAPDEAPAADRATSRGSPSGWTCMPWTPSAGGSTSCTSGQRQDRDAATQCASC